MICLGLKEYIGANPALASAFSTTIVQSKSSDLSESNSEFEDAEAGDEFYDATDDSSSEDDDSNNEVEVKKVQFWDSSQSSVISYYSHKLHKFVIYCFMSGSED